MYNVGKDIPNKDLAFTLGLAMSHDFQNSKLYLEVYVCKIIHLSLGLMAVRVDVGLGAVGLQRTDLQRQNLCFHILILNIDVN